MSTADFEPAGVEAAVASVIFEIIERDKSPASAASEVRGLDMDIAVLSFRELGTFNFKLFGRRVTVDLFWTVFLTRVVVACRSVWDTKPRKCSAAAAGPSRVEC